MMRCLKFSIILILIISLQSCGYSISNNKSLAIDSVKIGKIVNMTSEPRLQDMLNTALVNEFQRRGLTVSDSSENVLEGEITNYQLKLLSEKKKSAFEYQASVTGDFRLIDGQKRDQNGGQNVKELKGITSPNIDYFIARDGLNTIIATKQQADMRAIEGIALLIVTQLSIIHQ